MARAHHLPATGLLELRIELQSIEPLIWHQLVVPDTITLTRLHHVIQATRGLSLAP